MEAKNFFQSNFFEESTPWFPLHISELDRLHKRILTYGDKLDADHPGAADPVYSERRKYFADVAYKFRHGEVVSFIKMSFLKYIKVSFSFQSFRILTIPAMKLTFGVKFLIK